MHRQPIHQQLVVNRRIICPHIRLEDEVMVREVGQPLPYCIFESAMAFEMGTARRERQIVRETQRQRLHDHGISGRPQVHFRREPSGVYRQLTPLRTGMQQRDA